MILLLLHSGLSRKTSGDEIRIFMKRYAEATFENSKIFSFDSIFGASKNNPKMVNFRRKVVFSSTQTYMGLYHFVNDFLRNVNHPHVSATLKKNLESES